MSNVVIAGDASGTGTFTISAPNGNTDRTLVLPDEAGTIITTAGVPASAMPAGSVLQVVQSVWTTNVSTTSTSFVTTGHTASITPSSVSNKILVSLAGGGWYNANVSNRSNWTTIYRDAINIEPVANGGFEVAYFNTFAATPHSVTYLDNPATTSATTYTIYFKTESGGTNVYTQLAGGTPGVPVTLTLMEIAA